MTRFWNDLQRVCSKSKDWNAKYILKSSGENETKDLEDSQNWPWFRNFFFTMILLLRFNIQHAQHKKRHNNHRNTTRDRNFYKISISAIGVSVMLHHDYIIKIIRLLEKLVIEILVNFCLNRDIQVIIPLYISHHGMIYCGRFYSVIFSLYIIVQ